MWNRTFLIAGALALLVLGAIAQDSSGPTPPPCGAPMSLGTPQSPPFRTETVTRQVWIDPIFVTIPDAHGKPHRVLVQEGQFKLIEIALPAPPVLSTPAPPARRFPIQNRQRFQIQVEEVLVTLPDGALAQIALSPDRVIAFGQHMELFLPEDARTVVVRFKEWDWANKRFRLPVLEFACDLMTIPSATIF